ncbi:MAG: hypothetical protein KAJ73_08135 [Zetaproteobacteria bacterium]|nr:hypothetical protein [Zetaproteobacteria bacterium]
MPRKNYSRFIASFFLSLTLMYASQVQAQLPEGAQLVVENGSFFDFGAGVTVPLSEGGDGLILGNVAPNGIVGEFSFYGLPVKLWTESPITDLGEGMLDLNGLRGTDGWFGLTFTFTEISQLFSEDGMTYTLDFQGIVNDSLFFTGVTVTIHLEGSVILPQSVNLPPDCTTATADNDTLWPPNHKFVPVGIQGVTDPDDDPVVITIDSISQDEPVDGRGDGRFAPDGAGVGGNTASVRAERSGSKKVPGNGRVYHIGFTADDGQGGSCSGEVEVAVPHNRNAAVVNDGAVFDSTTP